MASTGENERGQLSIREETRNEISGASIRVGVMCGSSVTSAVFPFQLKDKLRTCALLEARLFQSWHRCHKIVDVVDNSLDPQIVRYLLKITTGELLESY